MFDLYKNKYNCLNPYLSFSKLITKFLKLGKKEFSENFIYDFIKTLKKNNFLGLKYFKFIYFLQYFYSFIRPKVGMQKYVYKFGKRKIRKRFKKGSEEEVLDYTRRLTITPLGITISRSYKLAIYTFLKSIYKVENSDGIKDKLVFEIKKCFLASKYASSVETKILGNQIILHNKDKIHFRWDN